jgi:hypothetical protein
MEMRLSFVKKDKNFLEDVIVGEIDEIATKIRYITLMCYHNFVIFTRLIPFPRYLEEMKRFFNGILVRITHPDAHDTPKSLPSPSI